MSTQPEPADAAGFDAMMRERADRAGRPLPRMSQRVAVLPPTAFLFQRSGVPHLLHACGPAAGTVHPFTVDDAMNLSAAGTGDTASIWCANRQALTEATAVADTAPLTGTRPDPVAGMRRTLTHLARAEHTARLVLIPDLLRRKYHPTSEVAGAPVRGWAAALGVTSPSARDPMVLFTELADMLCEGGTPTVGTGSPMGVIAGSERAVVKAAEWGGLAFQATQLAAAEASAAAWETVQRLDPLLTRRNLLAGLCSQGSPDPGTPTLVRVDGSARLRVGDDLLLTPDTPDAAGQLPFGFARLAGFRMVGGGLHAQLEPAGVADRRRRATVDTSGVDLLTRAAGSRVLLSARPYLRAAKRAYFGPRWGGRSVPPDRRVNRDVPLDVLLAGA